METLMYAVIPMLWAVSLIAVIVLLLSLLIKKSRGKDTKKTKRRLAVAAGLVLVTFIVIGTYTPFGESEETPSEPVVAEKIEDKKPEPAELSWKDNFSDELANEIESAFREIGENPDNIISIDYVDTHTSGYVFEQKCYKVEFSWSLGRPGYKHFRYYRMTTQNYYDGEPEKEQYPNEFLTTLKDWAGDDGHGTNINEWTWTGNGRKQGGN